MANETGIIVQSGMNLSSWVFFISFFGFTSLVLYQIYDLIQRFTNKNVDDVRAKTFTFFILGLFLWSFCLVVTLIDTSSLVFSVLFTVANFLLGLHVLLFIINIFMLYGTMNNNSGPGYGRGNSWLRRF